MTIKASNLVTKTIEAATASALDTAVAAFVQTLGEERVIATHFALVSGGFVFVIVYAT